MRSLRTQALMFLIHTASQGQVIDQGSWSSAVMSADGEEKQKGRGCSPRPVGFSKHPIPTCPFHFCLTGQLSHMAHSCRGAGKHGLNLGNSGPARRQVLQCPGSPPSWSGFSFRGLKLPEFGRKLTHI